MISIPLKNKIKHDFQNIEQLPLSKKISEIKLLMKTLVSLHSLKEITTSELGYYLTALYQFEEAVNESIELKNILKSAGLLELPQNQLAKNGVSQEKVTQELLKEIENFLA